MLSEGGGGGGGGGVWTRRWPGQPADAHQRAAILAALGTDEDKLLQDSRSILTWLRAHTQSVCETSSRPRPRTVS